MCSPASSRMPSSSRMAITTRIRSGTFKTSEAGHGYHTQELALLVDTVLTVEIAGTTYQDDDGGSEPLASRIVFEAPATGDALITVVTEPGGVQHHPDLRAVRGGDGRADADSHDSADVYTYLGAHRHPQADEHAGADRHAAEAGRQLLRHARPRGAARATASRCAGRWSAPARSTWSTPTATR